jgi:hypothetical protein
MKKKKGFSIEEHNVVSKKLADIHDELLKLKAGKAYGSCSKASRYVNCVVASLSKLRCELDRLVCQENPELPPF